MKKIIVIIAVLGVTVQGYSQFIRGSVQKSAQANKADIVFNATFTSNPGEYVNYLQFSLAIPSAVAAGVTASAVGTGPFANMGTLPQGAQYTQGSERIFTWVFANPAAAVQSWTAGTPFTGVQVTFSGSAASSLVRMSDLTNLGGGGNSNTYFAIVSTRGDVTDYGTLFFQIAGQNNLGSYPSADQFVETTGLVSLPVAFSSYDVKCNDKGALLTWSTASEQKSSKFEIQRSTNGTDWKTVGTVAAAGNSSDTRNYQYLDISGGGTAQYRIRQVDIDGQFTYTAVRLTSCRSVVFDVVLYPVPANDKVNVVIKSEMDIQTELRVVDMAGKTVRSIYAQINKGSTNLTVPVQSLANGQYVLVSADPALNISSKFVVAH